ncbi:hypothetical protein [Pseudoalteromonas sp. SR41-4]|uniref:hypothetical protein n=1 Tax=Pseudoalteromonas sp. SR41-4 TaxID=2760950 RepID=UPI001600A00C|nr:hypothetical protein [Pseudoalteromonas sp. SR41-4]MBB1292176.1 hypothetical protein [Pseudoalteromonas sp. SR41-4]
MKLLTQKITIAQLKVESPKITLQCNCCKRVEHGTIPVEAFIDAASYMGWRQVTTSHIEIEAACPSCVRELHEFYQSKQVSA